MKLQYFTPSSALPRRAIEAVGDGPFAAPIDRVGCGTMFGIVCLASAVAMAVVVALGLLLA
jgi:hypothetical protein